MTDDAEKKKVQKEKKKKLAKEQDELRQVMSNETGRRVLHRLLVRAGIYRTSFVQGQPDQTSYNEGNRYQGLMLLADIQEAAPGSYELMINENKKEN